MGKQIECGFEMGIKTPLGVEFVLLSLFIDKY